MTRVQAVVTRELRVGVAPDTLARTYEAIGVVFGWCLCRLRHERSGEKEKWEDDVHVSVGGCLLVGCEA
jgi:hypothetical protein